MAREAQPNPLLVEQAMDRALKAVEKEFEPIFGKRAVAVVNVATKDWAFGSNIDARSGRVKAKRFVADSLRRSAEEAKDVA